MTKTCKIVTNSLVYYCMVLIASMCSSGDRRIVRPRIVREDFKDEMQFELSFEEWVEFIVKENVVHSRGKEQDLQRLKNLIMFAIFTVP